MSDEEKEDFHIKPTDSLIIAAKIVKKNQKLNHKNSNLMKKYE